MNNTLPEYTDQELVAMPRVNLALLDQVLDYIIEHPKEWDQRYWNKANAESPCGTTFCFAGTTAFLSDLTEIGTDGYAKLVNWDGLDRGWTDQSWWQAGQELLGLTDQEAYNLFENTLDGTAPSDAQILRNVKVEVERIRARAKAQEAAFNRLAQEFIDAAGLDDVVKPGYECPESAEVMQGIKGGAGE